MASRINTPKQPLTSLATCVIQHVFTASDVADDCFGTLIHHAAVVFVVAVA